MPSLSAYLFAYLAGGITFIPLLFLLLFCHAYFLLPIKESDDRDLGSHISSSDVADKAKALQKELAALPPEVQSRSREPDAAAGYFAVCREYVPGGVNGKPPERTTATGAVVSSESPSVYQSMYRSIFERGKVQNQSMDVASGSSKSTRKARNVFYIVLRLGHLMLYDDTEQLEVRHVLSLSLYDIDIYAGSEDAVPEGELWVKRNCIRLKWRETSKNIAQDSKPFYLFSDNCSDKEDFYHSLLQNQDRNPGHATPGPRPLAFDASHIVKLVQQLHASEENMQTRWVNALIGRLFLGLYQTSDLQSFIHNKITKKIARVSKPTFIESISVRRIDLGDSAPLITNPKLRELTIDGDLTVEADIKYKGNLRLEIAAVARIDLGPRFKARRVDLLLAGICKTLEGHLLIRIKPPPSNRLWFAFDGMPKLNLSIEPIVSSRQITYSLILRAIESRIREVIGDTLVLPNWDDIPFSDSSRYPVRGGLWEEQRRPPTHETHADPEKIPSDDHEHSMAYPNVAVTALATPEKSMSTPALVGRQPTDLSSQSDNSSNGTADDTPASAITSGSDFLAGSAKPRTMRSNSFATAVVSVDPAVVHAGQDDAFPSEGEAARIMMDISSRSQPASPLESPAGSPSSQHTKQRKGLHSPGPPFHIPEEGSTPTHDLTGSPSSASFSTEQTNSLPGDDDIRQMSKSSTSSSIPKKQAIAINAVQATSAAKKWGLDLVARHSSIKPNVSQANTDQPVVDSPSRESLDSTLRFDTTATPQAPADKSTRPLGRGQPLPPPVSTRTHQIMTSSSMACSESRRKGVLK
ncbi:hypothetical protein EJ08DRAFT_629831 [Tothia fuscella]|uniref:SMP-LTD domain-containing protein n=1 Tax=Tothia fuscella TaxID=1048955 RepID=A0A9P4NX48_9PEZI|nr:hypothetical protein EJ08DRAFT_629831 [Tothia fuscella]